MPFVLTNGIRTHFEEAGSGSPLVFIHGHSLDQRLWAEQVAFFAPHFRIITYDVRGHGRSEAPATGYGAAIYGEDLRQLLDHLGMATAHLVGLSLGGVIALELALANPERVESLVLASSSLQGFSFSEAFVRPLEGMTETARREGVRVALERFWLPHPILDSIRRFPDRFAPAREMVLGFSGAEYLDPHPHLEPELPHLARLDEIYAPTLVMAGGEDLEDFQLIAEILAGGIPGAQKVTIPGAGHLVNLEAPRAFNEAVLGFLERIGGNE